MAIPVSFSELAPDKPFHDLVRYDARVSRGTWAHKHGPSLTAPYRVLSGECVVVVVGNYKCYSWIYEVICSSACTQSFATHVEAMSPPVSVSVGHLPTLADSVRAFAQNSITERTVFGGFRQVSRDLIWLPLALCFR